VLTNKNSPGIYWTPS